MAETRRTDQRLSAAEKRTQVVALRRQRASFDEIGRALGVTKQRAWSIYQKALQEVPAAELQEHMAEELALVDDAIANLWPLAHDHSRPRSAVEAWNCIARWAERKSRLLGLDAPAKSRIEVLTEEVVNAEIERIQADLARWEAEHPKDAADAMPPGERALALPPGEWTSQDGD